MDTILSSRARGPATSRSILIDGLQARRAELERATMARVYGIADPGTVGDPAYVAGLREAVRAAVTYAIAGIANRDRPPVPAQLYEQARHAARSGVRLDTVLRRYFAGHVLFGDFLMGEAERAGGALPATELRRALRAAAALFDDLVGVVAQEYTKEFEGRQHSAEKRRTELVRALLDGEVVDAADLRYRLDAWHLGALATGPGAKEGLRCLAVTLGRDLLLVQPDDETIWAWLGGRRRLAADAVSDVAGSCLPATVTVALGEPGRGLAGWHLTHRQARAALPIATRGLERTVRYSDVTLLASVLNDEVIASSLEELYLAPLEQEPDGGEALRRTLWAYFAAGRNVSSTAAALGVSRPTVKSRLGLIEERIGRPLPECAAEMETALQLHRLGRVLPRESTT